MRMNRTKVIRAGASHVCAHGSIDQPKTVAVRISHKLQVNCCFIIHPLTEIYSYVFSLGGLHEQKMNGVLQKREIYLYGCTNFRHAFNFNCSIV